MVRKAGFQGGRPAKVAEPGRFRIARRSRRLRVRSRENLTFASSFCLLPAPNPLLSSCFLSACEGALVEVKRFCDAAGANGYAVERVSGDEHRNTQLVLEASIEAEQQRSAPRQGDAINH